MEKWTGELADPPFWLDARLEVTSRNDAPKLPTPEFLVQSVAALRAAGCDLDQALDVTANAVNETGWGKHYRGWNLGGWKITKGTANEPDGSPRRWFRALGNKSSQDAQTCFYRAFTSLQAFYEAWLLQFVPKHGTGRYAKTGQEFWAKRPWFDDLIAAGYKGVVTQRNPDPSIREHAKIKGRVIVFCAQRALGVVADGSWGPKSKAACMAFQEQHGLTPTGKLDDATIDRLLDAGACSGSACKLVEEMDAPDAPEPVKAAEPVKVAEPAPAPELTEEAEPEPKKEEAPAPAPVAPAAPAAPQGKSKK